MTYFKKFTNPESETEFEYFVCPRCKKATHQKDLFKKEVTDRVKYCFNCGEEIATAYKEAMAEINNYKNS